MRHGGGEPFDTYFVAGCWETSRGYFFAPSQSNSGHLLWICHARDGTQGPKGGKSSQVTNELLRNADLPALTPRIQSVLCQVRQNPTAQSGLAFDPARVSYKAIGSSGVESSR